MSDSKHKVALIIGISGQDGAYLTDLLLKNNYTILGTSREPNLYSRANFKKLGINEDVDIKKLDPTNFKEVKDIITNINPCEIYNLTGQSSVGMSFKDPISTFESISISTLNILEVIRIYNKNIKYYNASSGEMFGDLQKGSANENTNFNPKSPYAVAKVAAHLQVRVYRESYGLFASSGILFNHESPLRNDKFVSTKIIKAVVNINNGNQTSLELGNIDIKRDWGYAREYVEAMWKMLQIKHPEDLVIATGESYSLRDFVESAFSYFNLNYEEHLICNSNYERPNEITSVQADPSKAYDILGWKARTNMHNLIKKLIKYYNV